jgi:uncharacterized membrane protein
MLLNPPFPLPIIVSLLAAAALLSAWSIRRSQTLSDTRARVVALALRLGALTVMGVVLCNPTLVLSRKRDLPPGRFAVLIDRSRSMSGARSRLADEVVGELFRSTALAGRLDVLGFGSRIVPLTQSGAADDESRLGQAVLQTLASAAARPLEALVLVSDGRTTDPENTAAMLRALVDSGVPACAVPAKDAFGGPPNLRVVSAEHDQTLSPGEPFELRATFSSSDPGIRSGTAKVSNDLGAEVARVALEFSRGKALARISLSAPSLNSAWRLDVDPAPGELYLDDNRAALALRPNSSAIRVLYMEGSPENLPDPETGEPTPVRMFLPRAWKAAGIQVDTYGVGEQTAQKQNLYRLHDGRHGFCPSPAELQSYDVLICSDISLANFSEEQLEWVRQWVADKGGGFMMIGGITSFADGGWHRTSWEKLIPFNMTGDRPARFGGFELRFDVKTGARHPVLQISEQPEENQRILQRGVYLGGTNFVRSLKPGATALAWHSESRDMPVLALQSYGRGRTMAFTSDAAGGWGHSMMTTWGPEGGRRSNDYYKRLWVNAVRWLAQNHLRGGSLPAELKPSALHVDAGETVRFTLRLLDLADAAVTGAHLDLGDGRPVPLQRSGPRMWSTETALSATRSGPRDVLAIMQDASGREVGRTSASVQVRAVSRELRDTTPDPALMATLAQASGGKLCESATDVRSFLQERMSRDVRAEAKTDRIPRWDRAWLLTLLLGLLCGEWAWRRLRAP